MVENEERKDNGQQKNYPGMTNWQRFTLKIFDFSY
jgi:hypothetical protein